VSSCCGDGELLHGCMTPSSDLVVIWSIVPLIGRWVLGKRPGSGLEFGEVRWGWVSSLVGFAERQDSCSFEGQLGW